jgi:hypothetical protein
MGEMSRHALLIGVGTYQNSAHYEDLTATVDSDLRLVHESLAMAGVQNVQRIGAGGTAVGFTQLKSAVAKFVTEAPENTDLLIYYSGHGHAAGGMTYLVPTDAHPELPDAASYLVPVSFETELAASKARTISFVIDACRTPPDGRSRPGERPVLPQRPRTTIVYASSLGEPARFLRAHGASSLFTMALAQLMTSAGDGVPLRNLQRRLQELTAERGRAAGLDDVPSIDVSLGPQLDVGQPFAFFAAAGSSVAGARWSGLLAPRTGDLGFDHEDPAAFLRLCGVLDEVEADTAGDQGDPVRTLLADPTLIDRLATAASLILKRVRVKVSLAERLAVLGVAGALEAAARREEAESSGLTAADTLARLAVVSPPLADAYGTYSPHNQRVLAAWGDHLLALRQALDGSRTLRAGIARVLTAALGPQFAEQAEGLSGYLADCLTEQLLGRDTGRVGSQLVWELSPPTQQGGGTAIEGRRVAMLVRLIWLLAADTRLLAPELGLGLIQDATAADGITVAEALHPLAQLAWVDLSEVIDLRLRTRSAPLDQALRQLTEDITSFLVGASQPGAPLYGLDIPHAATATRLGPVGDAFRLPHVKFELSAAETHDLLMGTNLYGNASIAIRELYQNAVDACTYRRWRLGNVRADALDEWVPEVIFAHGTDEDGTPWIECRDNGVGMSEYELRESFAKVGKRFRDLPEFLDETAEWGPGEAQQFRPISQFGIGVLSYFMIAERVVMWTVRSDRNGRLGEPLEVRISGPAGLFRVIKTDIARPVNGGTIVRLYLRREFAELGLARSSSPKAPLPQGDNGISATRAALASALRSIVAAPLVHTRFRDGDAEGRDLRWAPGRLYHPSVGPVSAFAAADLGVYFHDGPGRLLINGIPLQPFTANVHADIEGVTLSLDSRCAPRLSVDRERLLSFDRSALEALVTAAAARVGNWKEASVEWLLSQFRMHPDAGTAAFHALKGVDLYSGRGIRQDSARHPDRRSSDEAARVPTSRVGVFIFDPQIRALDESAQTRLDRETAQDLTPLVAERRLVLESNGKRAAGPGFPRFDERLIKLLNTPRRGKLSGIRSGRTSSGFPGSFSAWPPSSPALPSTLGAIHQAAAEMGVSIAVAAIFSWAIRFLATPARLSLARQAGESYGPEERYDDSEDCHRWLALIPIFSESSDYHAFLGNVQLARGDQAFPGPAASLILDQRLLAVIDAYGMLTNEARALVSDTVSGLPIFRTLFPTVGAGPGTVKAEVQAFMQQFPWLTPSRRHDELGYTGRRPAAWARLSRASAWTLAEVHLTSANHALRGSEEFDASAGIPPIAIALGALLEETTPDEVQAELTAAGYRPVVPADWTTIQRAADALRPLMNEGSRDRRLDRTGAFIIGDSMTPLAQACRRLGPATVRRAAELLVEAGAAAEPTERLARLGVQQAPTLERHAEVLCGTFPVGADVVTLARIADLDSVTLTESLATLSAYRPLIDPRWRLPDALPTETGTRGLSAAELAFFVRTGVDNDEFRDWAELAVQASALSGLSLPQLIDDVLPLLELCGEPTGDLRRLRAAWPDAITFDDLLILGCLQTWPGLSAAEVAELSEPACREAAELADRIARWMNVADVWVGRGERRIGRGD